MKQFKSILTQLLLVTTLMLPWATTEALETFSVSGVITQIGYDKFTVKSQQYRIAPGSKLSSRDVGRKKFKDFQEGDMVLFHGKILNGVHYVDYIRYVVPDDS